MKMVDLSVSNVCRETRFLPNLCSKKRLALICICVNSNTILGNQKVLKLLVFINKTSFKQFLINGYYNRFITNACCILNPINVVCYIFTYVAEI